MRVAVVHGYFLHDSGSGVYVRELTRALVQLGHDVTLVCQDREPARCGFIDSAYELDSANGTLSRYYEAPRTMPGSCRLVRPDLGGELLVYVDGSFPNFDRDSIHAFQDVSAHAWERYVKRNVQALRTIFSAWEPELVLAQHLIMQPYVVARALAGRAPYVVTEHGSALNFSVRTNPELVPFALEGLAGAVRIATVSEGACGDLIAWASEHGLAIAEKTVAMQPGIDARLFTPTGDRAAALQALTDRVGMPPGIELAADDDIVAFAGSLRSTKGIQHAIAAIPLVARLRKKRVRLLVAGKGPARDALERLATLAEVGDAETAKRLVESEPQLQSPPLWGEVVSGAWGESVDARVAFLGHLEHEQLAAVFASADSSVAPSVFPEAAALVNAEALSAGAVPVASNHSGMVELNDLLAEGLHDTEFCGLVPGPDFTRRLAEQIAHVLDRYPTKSTQFRRQIHRLAIGRYPTWEETADEYVAMAASADRPHG